MTKWVQLIKEVIDVIIALIKVRPKTKDPVHTGDLYNSSEQDEKLYNYNKDADVFRIWD